MPVILQVIIGGALGALSRYGVSQLLPASSGMRFPWNTFTANLVGCLVIGVVMGFVLNNSVGKQYLPLIIIGFLDNWVFSLMRTAVSDVLHSMMIRLKRLIWIAA